jgi:four helix bundle protein
MAQTAQTLAPAPADAYLEIERLDVYRVAREFLAFVGPVLKARHLGSLRDQLDRASTSIVLNIAEGAGRRSGADKSAFYVIARGSAMECAAILDVLTGRGILSAEAHRRGRGLLIRSVQMLTRLIGRFART